VRDFNAKVGRKDTFKPTIRNKSSHEICNDDGVGNLAVSKNSAVKCMMFPHRNIHKYTWISPEGKMHNQTDHVLIDRRWHSNILDVTCFRVADSDNNHYLVAAKVRERLAVSKRAAQKMDIKRFNHKKINEGKLKNSTGLQQQTSLQLWKT
jgi:hypothetical protein